MLNTLFIQEEQKDGGGKGGGSFLLKHYLNIELFR